MKKLILSLKEEYFNDIKNGNKIEEYRLYNEYWKRRLINREYDSIEFTLGYPKKEDSERRINKKYIGYELREIQHKHFGNETVEVFVIKFE